MDVVPIKQLEVEFGIELVVKSRSKSRTGTRQNKFFHRVESTLVRTDSSVRRNDRMWQIISSGREFMVVETLVLFESMKENWGEMDVIVNFRPKP